MKRSRACFKYVLRQCKANDNKAKAGNLAIKQRIRIENEHVLAYTVNGVSRYTNKTNMWYGYYKGLLNATSDTVNKRNVTQQFKCCKTDNLTISSLDVKEVCEGSEERQKCWS